ncbi:MAG: hypothetical protein HY423_10135 [Candidatus Lambdaproteobacteria bacterium]|nr:hypothetical protein [Candidatus Lambdaproteobacteria bacterium]
MDNEIEELDKTLQIVGQILSSLMSRYPLEHATTEPWRWDQPIISLQWSNSEDNIGRNINAYVEPKTKVLTVEVNAWLDMDSPDSKGRVRFWKHQIIGELPIPIVPKKFLGTAEDAYQVERAWTRDELKEKTTRLAVSLA